MVCSELLLLLRVLVLVLIQVLVLVLIQVLAVFMSTDFILLFIVYLQKK